MGKKAIVAVSFGTAYSEAMSGIENVESKLKRAFAEYDFYRSFTSRVVSAKIERESGIHTPYPSELLESLVEKGYTEIRCQSLHIIFGREYEKLLSELEPFAGKFEKLYIGRPLLWDTSDYLCITSKLLGSMPPLAEDEALVYMGHGTDHPSNAAYALVENCFRYSGAERVYVGTVEGFPGLDYILGRLKKRNISRVRLAPFMLVAGGHALYDLAGDEKDSWKSRLESEGYSVKADLNGLGDIEGVADIFKAHCENAFLLNDVR